MDASPYDLEQRVVSQTGESAHSGHLDVFDVGLEQSYDYLSTYPRRMTLLGITLLETFSSIIRLIPMPLTQPASNG